MTEQLLAQKPIVEQHLRSSTDSLSAFSFTNIFAWQDFFQFDLKVIEGCLCVFAQNESGCFLYLPPLGTNVTQRIIEECFILMEKGNQGNGVTRVDNVGTKKLKLFSKNEFKYFKKGYEYCYYKNDIINLIGNRYKSKRSSYNMFTGQYECVYEAYDEGMIEECLELYDEWMEQRKSTNAKDDIYNTMLRENRSACEMVLTHFLSLGLVGRVVKVGGKVKAFTFGYSINRDMFCIYLSMKGLAVFIFREFCRDGELAQYTFINCMDTFEMENVERVKMSFRPSVLLPMYVVTKREDV